MNRIRNPLYQRRQSQRKVAPTVNVQHPHSRSQLNLINNRSSLIFKRALGPAFHSTSRRTQAPSENQATKQEAKEIFLVP